MKQVDELTAERRIVMTDNEIVIALECCNYDKCFSCPLRGDKNCLSNVRNYAIALIKRQKAEIEDLRKIVFMDRSEAIKNLKSEARKEFAERIKTIIEKHYLIRGFDCVIDNLVKEMEK